MSRLEYHYMSLFLSQTGTMRLIYSFNPNDLASNTGHLDQHTVRGSKSVQLLSPERDTPKLPDDAFPYDFVMKEVCIHNLVLL